MPAGLLFAICASLLLAGCTPPAGYRVVVRDAVPVLVPPTVRHEAVSRTKIRVGKCPAETLDRATLEKASAGWAWERVAEWQSRGCLGAAGRDAAVAQLTESIALPLGVAYRLRNPNPAVAGFLDLRPGYRLRMVSPIFRDGAPANASAIDSAASQVAQAPGGLAVAVRASENLIGYETALFAVDRDGIHPIQAEARIGEAVTKTSVSRFRYLEFGGGVGFFRMLFLTRQSAADRDALVVAMPTESGLEAATRDLSADPAKCGAAVYAFRCVVLPRQVALTPFAVVTIDGEETLVEPGSVLRRTLRGTPVRMEKPYQGRLMPVRGAGASWLGLPLEGGERIWTGR